MSLRFFYPVFKYPLVNFNRLSNFSELQMKTLHRDTELYEILGSVYSYSLTYTYISLSTSTSST